VKYRMRIVAILTCTVLCPGILLAQPPPPESPAPQDRRVFVDVNQVAPTKLLDQLAAAIGCKLEVEGSLPQSAVSLRLSNVRARTALDSACDMVGCRWRIEGRTLHIVTTTPPPPITSGQQIVEKLKVPLRGEGWRIERVAVRDVLAWLSQDLGVQVVADNADPSIVISVDLRGLSPIQAFTQIQVALGWNVTGITFDLAGPSPLVSGVKPRESEVIHLTGRRDANTTSEHAQGALRIYEKGEPGLTMPRVTSQVHPQYSDEARRARIQGIVTLSCVVEVDGSVVDVNVARSLHPQLDDQSVQALRKWRFMPGLKDGKPVPVRVEIEMTFSLR
jgi:TonB family protein